MKATSTKTSAASVNPILAAVLAKKQPASSTPLVERAFSVAAASVKGTERLVGRVYGLDHTVNFQDGVKLQAVENVEERVQFWQSFAAKKGWSDADVAALLNA
jgi:hypothetical protein